MRGTSPSRPLCDSHGSPVTFLDPANRSPRRLQHPSLRGPSPEPRKAHTQGWTPASMEVMTATRACSVAAHSWPTFPLTSSSPALLCPGTPLPAARSLGGLTTVVHPPCRHGLHTMLRHRATKTCQGQSREAHTGLGSSLYPQEAQPGFQRASAATTPETPTAQPTCPFPPGVLLSCWCNYGAGRALLITYTQTTCATVLEGHLCSPPTVSATPDRHTLPQGPRPGVANSGSGA